MTADPASTAAAPVTPPATDPIIDPVIETVTEPVTGTVADAVAAAVLAVPGVAALHAGAFGEVATYLPGRRVTGVRLGEPDVEVHVVLELRAPIRDVAHLIRERVIEIVRRPVLVVVEDLATGPSDPVVPAA